MEVFIRGIPFSMEQSKLKELLASTLHSAAYTHHVPQPLNFDIRVHRKRSKDGRRSGIMTVPTEEVGEQFLRDYGGGSPGEHGIFGSITFERGQKAPNPHILGAIRRSQYAPAMATSQPRLTNDTVHVTRLQFGWVCSDEEFSVEWEKIFSAAGPATLTYSEDRREFRMTQTDENQARIVAIRVAQVYWAAASPDQAGEPSIFFYLNYLPSFEVELSDVDSGRATFAAFQSRQVTTGQKKKLYRKLRLRRPSFGDDSHLPIAPYTSIAIRMVCGSVDDIMIYERLCRKAHLPIDSSPPPVDNHELFSSSIRDAYQQWTRSLDFAVAFQIEGILRKWLLNMREAVEILRPAVDKIVSLNGSGYAGELLADLKIRLEARYWYGDRIEVSATSIERLLSSCRQQVYNNLTRTSAPHSDDFLCKHLRITPSTIFLDGPFPERSNRVVRRYWDNRENFIRVHFTDESGLAYRFDPEINIESLVDRRVKRFLDNGVNIVGEHFEFLGYSQSALKSHTVWFVAPFETSDGQAIDAATIISGLGNFENNPYDPKLINCPARYAARISQAFTTTDSSITVAVEDMEIVPDMMDSTGTYSFTDGNGTMSLQVARDIAADQRLKGRVRRAWRMHGGAIPRILQVRIAGSKGMLHVDHRLDGRKIRLPKSMVKFDAPSSNRIEIAQLFEESSPFYLNRPMIVLLEGLGVPRHVFQSLQDNETRAAGTLMETLKNSGWLLDRYSLGNSFKLSFVIRKLCECGVSITSLSLNGDGFWSRMMSSARNHILRELKYHARIPVSAGWTLVGIADVHGQLDEGEIYACVRTPDGHDTYFEGPTLITRSPVIHPGDIQVVHAIGRPPEGSDLAKGQLKNCVIFSTRGERPLPSYLGGGDLDGDMYNITNVPRELLPTMSEEPASYAPAQRNVLARPSTMRDVSKFVAEFILSENVGVIADAWLKLADTAGIFDDDCLRLAELNSAAVDYPKTGRAVPMSEVREIVDRRIRQEPDWYIPEATNGPKRKVYQSQKALGQLFRSIDLPDQEDNSMKPSHSDSPEIDEDGGITYDEVLADIRAQPIHHSRLLNPVADLIRQYLPNDSLDEQMVEQMWNLFVVYARRLKGISAKHVISTSRSSLLSEEELVIGTISAKCAQARRREDLVTRLREQTAMLADSVCFEMSGGSVSTPTRFKRAWTAYRVSCTLAEWFGGRSFGWIALGEIFDAVSKMRGDQDQTH